MKRPIFLILALVALSLNMLAATPKYVFYFIGDGMGMGHVMAAQTYNRMVLGSEEPLLMMQFPHAGMVETYSASATVTDSAAAGTALATGKKTRNYMLGMDPDTVAIKSIAKVLHDDGWGVGVITSVAPDDATPGAFYAHVPTRKYYYEIGRQAAESGYEIIGGATWRGTKVNGEPSDLFDYMRANGIDIVTDVNDAANSSSRRVVLYSTNPIGDSNVGFTVDGNPEAMKLSDMTRAALEHLKRVTPDKFFLMVEGGNIDYSAHANDGAGVVKEILNFNEALRYAYDFYLEHPDETLILVTADHDTGGLSLGNRVGFFKPEYIPFQQKSKDLFSWAVTDLLNTPDAITSWDDFKAFAAEKTGLWTEIPVQESQEKRIKKLYDQVFEKREKMADEKTLYSSFNVLANEVYKVLNENQGFGWTSSGHTGNPVPIYAIGEGMEFVAKRIDNTDIVPGLCKLIGVDTPNR